MKYTIKDFQREFATDDICLEYIFEQRFGKDFACPSCGALDSYYRVQKRKSFACACGHQVNPTAGTIFEKSATRLTLWFYAIFLMSQSKNGVSAKELERHLGVTYKTAWRMGKQIKTIMAEGDHFLFGEIEADETYIGGSRRGGKRGRGAEGKTLVMGALQRDGKMNTRIIPNVKATVMFPHFKDHVAKDAEMITDELHSYKKIFGLLGLSHRTVNHRSKQYAKPDGTHTNTIESFWGQLKRSLSGTYHVVSPKYLHLYVSEFVFRRNHQNDPFHLFDLLLSRVCVKPTKEA